MNDSIFHDRLPLIAFILATLTVLYCYSPILMPLANKSLEFCYRDFSSIVGADSGHIRNLLASQVRIGDASVGLENARSFLLFGMTGFTENFGFSDSMMQSLLALISILMGCCGIYLITGLYIENRYERALLIPICILFYFLNMWATERMIFMWIWYAYSVFPMSLFLGLKYLENGNRIFLLLYSLVIGIFGVFPHPGVYFFEAHALLSIYALLVRDKKPKWIYFVIVPVAIYILLNLPVLLLTAKFSLGAYPARTDLQMLDLFSRYGDSFNIFSFSNNWWPQVSPDLILKNLPFLVSSAGFIASAILLFIMSSGRFSNEKRLLMAVCIISIALLIFAAQGTNNPIIKTITDLLDKTDKGWIIGSFRDWGRICILIPQFILLLWTACFSKLDPSNKRIFMALLIILLGLNLYSSPGWGHMNKIFSAVEIPQDYYKLDQIVSADHRILLITPNEGMDTTEAKYIWNPGKIGNLIIIGGSPFSMYDSHLFLYKKDAPAKLLDALGIEYVIRKRDFLGSENFDSDYSWLDCEDMEYFTVCRNSGNAAMFRIYDGTVSMEDDPETLYNFMDLGQDRYAPVMGYSDNSTEFLYFGNVLPDGMQNGGNEAKSAEITNFTMENSHATVEINASQPFLLSFAKDYSPFWRADAIKDGKTIDVVRPIKIYGLINGFWINDTGSDIRVEISSEPQELFDILKTVSLVAFFTCICGIAYMILQRGNGDG